MSDYRVLHRSEHPISRKQFSQPTLKVLYRLKTRGYWAFLVGGALRDLLRGRPPRDFDVATNATIPEIRALFRNSKIIGKRFPIVHAYFGGDLVEISSLKAEDGLTKYEMLYADAVQRDFTVNSIFYDIKDFKVIDPLGALEHVEKALVIPIGDVEGKFREDPIRMLRALKLVAKHGFSLGPGVADAIRGQAKGWKMVGSGRRYEELTRVLLNVYVGEIIALCRSFGLFADMWPKGEALVTERGTDFIREIRKTIPVHLARGSYAKHSHTHLWLFLFLKSGWFRPTTSVVEVKEDFDRFIEPLGMPFRTPVVEALHGLGLLRLQEQGSFDISREARKLMEFFVEHEESDLLPRLREWLQIGAKVKTVKKGHFTKTRKRPYRRRRRRRRDIKSWLR